MCVCVCVGCVCVCRGGVNKKERGEEMRSPGVVTELVGWMLKRGSEQRKRRLLKKVISCVKWIHKL